MTTECYAMVRGSVLRVTELDKRGRITEPTRFATSKSVSRVRINEVTDAGSNETLRTPEDEPRLRFTHSAQTIRHKVDIEFLCVDPALFGLITGMSLIYRDVPGFGEVPFGVAPFGAGEGEVLGFDAALRLPAKSFALEVWSKLAGVSCADGQPAYGYTLFPFLKGGYLSGFTFANAAVAFTLIGAQTRRASRWGVGPYDLEGPFERLIDPVSRNTSWRTLITPGVPPVAEPGLQELRLDFIDNGTPGNPMPDPDALLLVDGGGPVTSAYIIDGGQP